MSPSPAPPPTNLIQIQATEANGVTTFAYVDLATGQDAKSYPRSIRKGDCFCWIATLNGQPIGGQIYFNNNGSPFAAYSIAVPAGGLSARQTVINTKPSFGDTYFKYTVTLSDLSSDDPIFVPCDGCGPLRKGDILPTDTTFYPIAVQTDAHGNVTLVPNAVSAKAGIDVIQWNCATAGSVVTVKFTGPSPFMDPTNPVPDLNNSQTVPEKVGNTKTNFPYTVDAGLGGTSGNGTITVG